MSSPSNRSREYDEERRARRARRTVMDLKHTAFTTLQITASSCLRGFVVAFVVVAGCGLDLVSAQRRSADWPQWRGPNRDGVVSSFTEPKTWPQQLTKTWKVDVGIGYSTPVLVGDRIYMYSRRGDKEVLAALDAGTGKEIWQSGYAAPFNLTPAAASHDKGPKSSPRLMPRAASSSGRNHPRPLRRCTTRRCRRSSIAGW